MTQIKAKKKVVKKDSKNSAVSKKASTLNGVQAKIKITANHCDNTDKYIPKYENDNSYFKLYASIKPVIHDHQYFGSCVKFGFRTIELIDCGVSVELPKGYKLCLSLSDELSKKGLFITNAPVQVDNNKTIQFMLANFSHEITTIEDGDYVAKGWIEPIYKVEWIKEF